MENIEFMPGGILIYSLSQKKIVKINSKALEIFGFESFKEFNENQGEEFEGLAASAEDLNRLRNSLTCFVESNTKNFSCIFTRIKTKNGTAVFIEDFWELVNDSDLGSLFYIFVVPLNKRVLDTYFDPITGLYTRNHFSDTLEQQRFNYLTEKSGKQRYIISFNIVRFKLFNTAFGIEGGNRCLKKIAESFREIFQCEMIARFSGDRFVIFYEEDDVVTKIQLAHERVLSLYENFSLWLEAGVYRYDGKVPVITACDFAKIACDAIHLNKEHFYCLYTERLRNELELKKYVQDNIDKAIRNGYIEIFYQPILRTLSGRLCGMEALARWNDPSHGFMPADIFIPALEESQTCYKLDAYVVEQISKSLSIRIDKGLPVVPVSLNFSIRDFELSHVSLLKILNENILKYGLSCEYIKIELSETSAIEDEKKVLEEIKKFRDAGFEVIMDDFGSGNSSFKTLKNVNFDEIKIDMSLVENFDLKSTTIITSIIEMSKKLGIRTLAEGIESESQAEFLKNLGCEKIQGFFFDRPQPEKMFWQHIAEKNISVENRMNRYFYDEIGKVNFLTGESIALFEYNASGIREVFLNAQYKKSLALSGLKENKALEKIFSSSKYDLGKKLKKLANSALKKRKKVSADFILNNRLCSLTFESIAECPEYSMLLSTINSIPLAKEKNLKEEFDSVLRNLVTAYETVFVCDAEKNTIRCIYTAESGFRGNNSLYLSEQLLSKIEGQIYRADIERFKKIMSRSYVESALEKSASGTLTEFFRVKNPDGTFHWKFFTIVPIAESLGTKYVVGVRPAELFGEKNNVLIEKLVLDQDFLSLDSTSIKNLYSNEYNLWNSMISDSQIKFFWKDTKRRFLGASQSFLDYYGFKSADEIIGKTDDDLHWHIEDESFRDDEYKVLHDGEIIINRHGQNIIKGILHNISATKFPLYKNGKICGLIGYFTDLDSILPEQLKIKNAAFTDSVTQFMTARGFLVALFGYEDNLYIHGEDYTIGLLEIPEYLFFYKTYGKETAEILAKMIADKIRLYFDESTILGRIQHGRFAVCTKKIKSLSEMREIIRECTESIMDIREVDGKRCGLHVRHGEVLGSEAHSSLQLLELLVNRMSDYQKKNWDFSVTELKIRLKDMGVFFDDISVVDIASNQVVGFYDDGSTFVISDNCCKILGNEKKCGTCIAAKALSKMGSASKFEIINDNIYFMIAHGITVENKSYVIEGIMKLDDLPFANENKKTNSFFDKLSKYSIEIYLDSLTKAHNRKYYDEQIAETNCQAIAFLDMNKFKFINDTYGHRLGDYVLQKTSEAIISSIRTKDTVSRYGGDEFIVCFEEISFEEFEKCLMQIHRNVAKICYGDENEFRASVSIGGCFGPGKACELVVKADDALYDAKKNHGIKIVRG